MNMEGFSMARVIINDNSMYLKLMAASILLNAAKTKVELHMSKKQDLFKQMIEDQYSLEMLTSYYLEEQEELEQCAKESLFTAAEADKEFYTSLGEGNGRERY